MKKIISHITVLAIVLLFTACLKENHSIRFQNNYNLTIDNVVAGTAQFGSVNPGQTSKYVPIKTGDFTISGVSSLGGRLTGSGSIKGKGTHKWTIVLSASGDISINSNN